MNITTRVTTVRQSSVQEEWVRWISGYGPTHLFDFNPNRNLPYDSVRAICSTLHHEYDKEVAKSFKTNIKAMKRTYAVFAVECSGGQLHVHSRWRLPTQKHRDVAQRMFGLRKRPRILKKICKSKAVTSTFQEITDLTGSVAYCLKKVALDEFHPEHLILSDDFFTRLV